MRFLRGFLVEGFRFGEMSFICFGPVNRAPRRAASKRCCASLGLNLSSSFFGVFMIVPPQDLIFVCDESGISTDRYTVVGGMSMYSKTLQRAYDTLKQYRETHRMQAELKWTKISNKKVAEYQALVDYFFAMNNTDHIHFHAICFDSHQWNHTKYNDGNADTGLSKLYYQLMLHRFVKLHGRTKTLYIRVDHRNSQTPLEEIRRMLNSAAARDHGIHTAPVKQFVSCDSKECDLLQLNDVILGAVCAARNGRHLVQGGRMAKAAIASLVLEKSGLQSFEKDSPFSIKRFTVWNMRPRPR